MNRVARRISQAILVVALAASAGCLNPRATATGPQPAAEQLRREGALVIWDGANTPRYLLSRSAPVPWNGGGGWAACDSKPTCRARFSVTEGAGVGGDRGLQLHGEGSAWIGGGWNWANWRSNAARDLTPFTKLTFQIRVQIPADTASGLAEMTLALASKDSPREPTSATVRIRNYDPTVLDGGWHKVTVPLAALTGANAGAGFDLSAAWELRLSTWSAAPRNFDIYLDQIVAER